MTCISPLISGFPGEICDTENVSRNAQQDLAMAAVRSEIPKLEFLAI
jgi:hypothetical protein